MIVGKSNCQIDEIDGISFPMGEMIQFTENTGVKFCMRILDIMRINAVIEQNLPTGVTREQYIEMLQKK